MSVYLWRSTWFCWFSEILNEMLLNDFWHLFCEYFFLILKCFGFNINCNSDEFLFILKYYFLDEKYLKLIEIKDILSTFFMPRKIIFWRHETYVLTFQQPPIHIPTNFFQTGRSRGTNADKESESSRGGLREHRRQAKGYLRETRASKQGSWWQREVRRENL